ncbi:hypothetical protein N431DRAFT_438530 [Stipitochalara longipes BDJ]|nr:hypothetical protein N431DRAFT_438530 [Stipitochalara longipes BDJ]
MPSLDDPTSTSPNTTTTTRSRSHSPVHPPYSPITPTLSSARLASTTSPQTKSSAQASSIRYTHTQAPQTSIQPPQLPVTTVSFDDNPDVLALKSAASILQIQARNAVHDIQALQRIKELALRKPEEFGRALESGAIRTRNDPLYHPGDYVEDEDDGEEEDGDVVMGGVNGSKHKGEKVKKVGKAGKGDKMEREKWEPLPAPQNVVRCPPINWNQYAVVGESLEKIHKDQLERPSEGFPARLGSDGQLVSGGEGPRRQSEVGAVIAAPYQPGRDRIEKMSTRKGGKR